MKEIFRDLELDGKLYEVSNIGTVRRVLDDGSYFYYKNSKKSGGYFQAAGYGVHQWVAMAFLQHTPNKHELVVHHIDGNPSNNHVDNLEVITQSKNILERNVPRTSIFPFVGYNEKICRFVVIMKVDGKQRYYGSFETENQAATIARELCKMYKPDIVEDFDKLL